MKTINKIFSAVLLLLISGIFSCQDPNTPAASFTVTVTGQVLNLGGAPQDSVQLILNNPFRNTDTTTTNGMINFSFTSEEKNEVSTTLRFHHVNFAFFDTIVPVVYSSTKKSIIIGEMRMKGVSSAIDSVPPPSASARAGAIVFISTQYPNISIRGAGGNEATKLTFQVRDSAGVAVDAKNSLMVHFKLISKPDNFTELSVDSLKTNSSGQVSVLLTGGFKAGLIQIQASAMLKNSKDTTVIDTIKSTPAAIPVYGGFPDSAHFSIGPEKFNVPGGVIFGQRVRIGLQIGDKWGNHAQPGIPVYFTTTGGQIKGSEVISDNGQLSVDLVTGNPFPANGLAVVTAEIPISDGSSFRTINPKSDVNNVLLKYVKGGKKSAGIGSATKTTSTMRRSTTVLFSGPSVITVGDSFFLTVQNDTTIQFIVSDPIGNPLSSGTTVKVSGVGFDSIGLKLMGQLTHNIPDTYDRGWTQFSVQISDQRTTRLTQVAPVLLSIEVNSPNGNVKKEIQGFIVPDGFVVPGGPSTNAKFVSFLSSQFSSLSIAGSGGISSTSITFIAKDSLGRPIDALNSTTMLFKLRGDPSLGVKLNIDSIRTSSTGRAAVILTSGSKAGMAQVQAILKSDTTIKSDIVSIPVYGGLPDSSRFSLKAGRVNLPGGVRSGDLTSINVLLGDKFGNPPQPGTPIYFTTNGGQVDGTARTSTFGDASVVFVTGNPYPPNGIATITAEVPIAEGGLFAKGFNKNLKTNAAMSTMKRSVDILFTGQSRIIANDTDFVIPVQTDKLVYFTVCDPSGYPLSSGSSIQLDGIGFEDNGINGFYDRVELSGDLSIVIPDTKDPAWTQFSFGIIDRRSTKLEASKELSVTINVNSPNGNVRKTIRGFLGSKPRDTTGIPPSQLTAAQIKFDKVSTKDIFVSGVGGVERADLDYTVLDSLGFPIDLKNKVGANFSLIWFPNSFTGGGTPPVLVTAIDSSDSQGRIGTTIVSGTQAGAVQLIATINLPNSKTITSAPIKVTVHAGFPDQKHFTFATPARNFPGLDRAFINRILTAQVTDKYSNPVIPGTAVYFNSAHGTMTTGNVTDATGLVSATLNSANPIPAGVDTLLPDAEILSYYPSTKGFSRVYARTLGINGAQVTDSILLLWTGSPRFTNTGASTYTIPDGGSAGPFTFTILDRFGHPMSAGTSFEVTSSNGRVSGDTKRTIPDAILGGPGITTFSIMLDDLEPGDIEPPKNGTIGIILNHPVYGTYEYTLASGTVD